MIAAIVVTGPPGLFPEKRMSGHRLAGHDPMLQLPCPLQLVQVLGADVLEILRQRAEQCSSERFNSGSLVT
jgi:hypothetical protein